VVETIGVSGRLGHRWCGRRACRKEPEGRLETRPPAARRPSGKLAADRPRGPRGDDKPVRDAVKRARQEERARHRPNPQSSHRCRAPHRAGHGCRESISRAASSCRSLIGVTGTANGSHRPTLPLPWLPNPGRRLQPLRPGPDLLRRWLRPGGTPRFRPGSRPPLPEEPKRPPQACRKKPPLPAAPAECDASGFYATGTR
jgi:hypothetical protein